MKVSVSVGFGVAFSEAIAHELYALTVSASNALPISSETLVTVDNNRFSMAISCRGVSVPSPRLRRANSARAIAIPSKAPDCPDSSLISVGGPYSVFGAT